MLGSRPVGITFEGDYHHLTKTPGNRMLKSRSALQENVGRHVPVTVDGKAKKAALQQTPFHPNALQPQKILKDHDGTSKSKGKEPVVLASSRPLGDKTPFPNRIASHATPLQMTKPVFDVTPGALLRPSSARKHVRLPRSASKSFQTPVTGGHHWDVSDIDINPEVAAAPSQLIEEDYDEIEYMPPKLPEMPYELPFELPNYKEVGRTLLALTHSYPIDDIPSHAIFTEFTAAESDGKFFAQCDLSLPHLDDDSPFSRVHPAPKPEPGVTRAPLSSKNTTRPTRTTTYPSKTIRAASTVAHSTPADTSRPRSGSQAVSRSAATRLGMTTSKPATRAASSTTVVRGHTSRTPSTRAPSTTVSRAPSTTVMTRTRPASALPTGIKLQAGPASRFGAQPRASAHMKTGMPTKKTAQEIGIVFENSWQEEEFRFSI
ncbi:hypothetical protein EDB19DRAFT_1908932 [Suillus lakei]|nr:hypothetical protein EDB19DRAFT_1908932 [Suillus lakei]